MRYVSCENGVMGLGKVSFGMSYYTQKSMRFTFSGCRVTLPLHPHLLSCVNLFVVAACLMISPWTVTHRLTLSCGSYSRDGGASLQLAGVNLVSCECALFSPKEACQSTFLVSMILGAWLFLSYFFFFSFF